MQDPELRRGIDNEDPAVLIGQMDGPPPPDPLDRFIDGILPGTDRLLEPVDATRELKDVLRTARNWKPGTTSA